MASCSGIDFYADNCACGFCKGTRTRMRERADVLLFLATHRDGTVEDLMAAIRKGEHQRDTVTREMTGDEGCVLRLCRDSGVYTSGEEILDRLRRSPKEDFFDAFSVDAFMEYEKRQQAIVQSYKKLLGQT